MTCPTSSSNIIFTTRIRREEGGTPAPGSFSGHWSQILSGRAYLGPRFFPRSLVPGPFWGNPSPGGGVPQSWSRGYLSMGYSPDHDRTGVPPLQPGQDGVLPPPPPDSTAERALAMRRAVCLLRSRSRTFLFDYYFC